MIIDYLSSPCSLLRHWWTSGPPDTERRSSLLLFVFFDHLFWWKDWLIIVILACAKGGSRLRATRGKITFPTLIISTLFVGNFDFPPSSSISTKYKAPLRPQGSWETSTSKVNSLMTMIMMRITISDHEPVLEVEHVVVLFIRSKQVCSWTNVSAVGNKLKQNDDNDYYNDRWWQKNEKKSMLRTWKSGECSWKWSEGARPEDEECLLLLRFHKCSSNPHCQHPLIKVAKIQRCFQ